MKRNRNKTGWIVFFAGWMSASGWASVFSGAGGDLLFSNTNNWGVYPSAGEGVTFAANSTSVSTPAQVDSGFSGLIGANRLKSVGISAAAPQTTYVEILNGGNLEAVTVNVGWPRVQPTRKGDLTLKTGGRLQAGNGLLSGSLVVGQAVAAGQLTIEAGATLIATKVRVNSAGSLVYQFGADSVTTMTTTSAAAPNTMDGLLRLDLGALKNAPGSYTLINSRGGALAGALKTWLDSGGGSRSGSGDISTANFEIVNCAIGLEWVLATDGENLTFDVVAAPVANTNLPNIVFIMADDLGYNDLSCQGATKLHTPNIDRIAQEGMRFTDAHSAAAICCPSRYSVLTGRYPWRRSGSTWAAGGAALLIEEGRMTTASLLKQVGYTTGIVGKWHIGFGTMENRVDWNGELKPGPLEVGFDYFFGDVNNRWGCYVENHRILGLTPDDPAVFKRGRRISGGNAAWTMKHEENATVLHNKAVAFIEKNQARPFFLHYAPNNVHTPLTPNARFKGTSQCGVYGDFVHELDWSVGEILTTLDRLGLATNTLVIFTSDNGGVYNVEAMEAGHFCVAPLNGQKVDVWEGGCRVPFLARWPGHVPVGITSDRLLCLTDLLATFAAMTEQGLPVEAGPDSFNALPLLLNEAPSGADRKNLIMQSSFGATATPRHWLDRDIWAVRDGNWKLVLGQGSGASTQPEKKHGGQLRFRQAGLVNSDYTADGQIKPDAPPMQLYDLINDLGETNNVYNACPETAERLIQLFEKLRDAGRSRP